MSLLNQNNKKGKKDKKQKGAGATKGKSIQKSQNSNFVSKQQNTGSQRGS